MHRYQLAALILAMAPLALFSCGKTETSAPAGDYAVPEIVTAREATSKTLRLAIIAKSQSNPVFQAARKGAMDAGKELGKKYGAHVEVLWQTPVDEDAQEQADRVEQLANQGVDGIAISCSEAGKVTPAINSAVNNRGVRVMCFDSDAPNSARFAYHGIDDVACGRRVMEELAKLLDGKGKVAILAGNQTAPNLQKRVQGVREVAANSPDIEIVDTFYHKETPQDAAAKVEQVMQANPDINGWAMVGGWALFTSNALPWTPGSVKCVSVDALPAQLSYLESGHVDMLLAQQVYHWGYRSVDLLLDNIVNGAIPQGGRDISDLVPVTKESLAEYAENWKTWLPE